MCWKGRTMDYSQRQSEPDLWITVERCPVCSQRHERLPLTQLPMGVPGSPMVTHEVECPVVGTLWHITVWDEVLIRARMHRESELVLLEPRGAEIPGDRKGFKGEKDEPN